MIASPSPSSDDHASSPNLSNTQCDLLCLHHRLGHIHFSEIQHWAREHHFGIPEHLACCKASLCSACLYGSLKKWSHSSATGALINNIKAPGDFVSVDQMISGTGSHIPFQVGCPSHWQYHNCTLWVNHYSKYLFGHLQETAMIKEMLLSKEAFETFATCYNVQVHHIRSVFASTDFAKHIKAHGQCHSICGVSAHWQNGLIE